MICTVLLKQEKPKSRRLHSCCMVSYWLGVGLGVVTSSFFTTVINHTNHQSKTQYKYCNSHHRAVPCVVTFGFESPHRPPSRNVLSYSDKTTSFSLNPKQQEAPNESLPSASQPVSQSASQPPLPTQMAKKPRSQRRKKGQGLGGDNDEGGNGFHDEAAENVDMLSESHTIADSMSVYSSGVSSAFDDEFAGAY